VHGANLQSTTSADDLRLRRCLRGKTRPKGNILFATYLGGSGVEQATGIAVDPAGNVYVAGTTGSSGTFPTTAGSPFGGGSSGGVFVAKLNSTGAALVYSFLIPGLEGKASIVADDDGNPYFAGSLSDSTSGSASINALASCDLPVVFGEFRLLLLQRGILRFQRRVLPLQLGCVLSSLFLICFRSGVGFGEASPNRVSPLQVVAIKSYRLRHEHSIFVMVALNRNLQTGDERGCGHPLLASLQYP
jgi:hypothetical protein